jgi:hypothetical protein
MNKQRTQKEFSLMLIRHILIFVIAILFLSSNFVAADEQNNAQSKNKGTAKYAGTLSGEWKGEVMSYAVDGTFSITISAEGIVSGTFSGLRSGIITGTVSDIGELNAEGSAGISEWNGKLNIVDGRVSGSGKWIGYGGSGSWITK